MLFKTVKASSKSSSVTPAFVDFFVLRCSGGCSVPFNWENVSWKKAEGSSLTSSSSYWKALKTSWREAISG